MESGYFIDGKKPTIITLNYSNCPMLCNVQLSQLAQSLGKLDLQIGEDFQVLTVSINPRESDRNCWRDKGEVCSSSAITNPVPNSGWAFCTANSRRSHGWRTYSVSVTRTTRIRRVLSSGDARLRLSQGGHHPLFVGS